MTTTTFSFGPILANLPMPEGLHHPRRALLGLVEHEGHQMYRALLMGPDDTATCFGLGATPEMALRAALSGLLQMLASHGCGDTTDALAYVRRMTLN